jgi:hypothetical protein
MLFPVVSFVIPVSVIWQSNSKAPAQDVEVNVRASVALSTPTQIEPNAQQFIIVAIELNLQCAVLAHSPRTIVDVSKLTGSTPVGNAKTKSNHFVSFSAQVKHTALRCGPMQ